MSERGAAFVVFGLAWTALLGSGTDALAAGRAAPPFPTAEAAAWIGTPQSLVSLRGKVVLLDVWTFG